MGRSIAVMISATEIFVEGLARLQPPFTPRWETSKPAPPSIFRTLLAVGRGTSLVDAMSRALWMASSSRAIWTRITMP